MPTRQKAQRRPWNDRQDRTLRTLVDQNTPTRVIGVKLDRSPSAIYSHARSIGLSLRPTNQSPYGRSSRSSSRLRRSR